MKKSNNRKMSTFKKGNDRKISKMVSKDGVKVKIVTKPTLSSSLIQNYNRNTNQKGFLSQGGFDQNGSKKYTFLWFFILK